MIFALLQAKYFGKRHQQKVNNQEVNNKINNQIHKVIKWIHNHKKEVTHNSTKNNNNHKKIQKNNNIHKNQNNQHKEHKDKDNSLNVSIIKENYYNNFLYHNLTVSMVVKKYSVIVKRQNVLNFIVIVSESIKHVMVVIVLVVII